MRTKEKLKKARWLLENIDIYKNGNPILEAIDQLTEVIREMERGRK